MIYVALRAPEIICSLKEVDDMVEETKQEEKVDAKKILSTIFKVILALVFLVLGVLAIIKWIPALWTVATGCIGLFLILAGIITLAIAKE